MRRTLTKESRLEKRSAIIECYNAAPTEYPAEDCTIATYSNNPSDFSVLIFDGSAGKPIHYYFKTEEKRTAFIEKHLATKRSALAYKAEQKAKNKGSLTNAAATAKAIRAHLKREFPEVKFSVTSDNYSGGNSVNIHYTDGPITDLVNHITKQYQYGSFDGMTDCYDHHDISPALNCPGAKYISCSRDQSTARIAELESHCQLHHKKSIEEFLEGNYPRHYEKQHPETWLQTYQDRHAINQATDNEQPNLEITPEPSPQILQAPKTTKPAPKHITNLADYKLAKQKEIEHQERTQTFLTEILPNLSSNTLENLLIAMSGKDKDKALTEIYRAYIEATLKKDLK